MSENGGHSEQFLTGSQFHEGGQETKTITPKRKFYLSSSGVTESPSKKQRTSENFKQKLMFWSNMEKSENVNRTHCSSSKNIQQSKAEHFSDLLVSPSLGLGGGQGRQLSGMK